MLGVIRLIFEEECGSTRGVVDFFSVARTMPFVAITGSQYCIFANRTWDGAPLIPNEVTPWLTALSAYSTFSQLGDHYDFRLEPFTNLHQLSAVTKSAKQSTFEKISKYLGEKVVSEKE